MSVPSWIRSWKNRLNRPGNRSPIRKRRVHARPRLETLEDRTAPAAGALDPTFGAGGVVSTHFDYYPNPYNLGLGSQANAVAVQADGKIVVAGYSLFVQPINTTPFHFAVARYQQDGSLDGTFGTDGRVTVDFGLNPPLAIATGVALQADGKIVVIGYALQTGRLDTDFALARLNSNGSLDTSFGGGGTRTVDFGPYDDFAFSVAVQPDGKIIVAGVSAEPPIGTDSPQDFVVLRLNSSDGSLDSSFGIGGTQTITFKANPSYHDGAIGAVVQPDGKIVVVGYSEQPNVGSETHYVFAVTRLNSSDGSLDTSFGIGGKQTIDLGSVDDGATGVALQADGKIVVGGFSYQNGTGYYDLATCRLTTDGSLDTSFGSAGKQIIDFGSTMDVVNGIVVQTDGKIVMAGNNSRPGTGEDFAVAQLDSDGNLDSSFGTGGKQSIDFGRPNDFAQGIGLQADGKILVVGHNVDFLIARLLGAPVTVSNGQVLVSATSDNDTISMNQNGSNLVITANFLPQPMTIPLAGITGIRVYGEDGNDQISLSDSGTLGAFLDGQGGSDQYTVNFGSLPGPVTIADSGNTGTDNVTVNGTAGDDVIVAKNGTVTWGSPVTETVAYSGVENATINGQAGNDTITDPNSTNLTLLGGPGNDTIIIANTLGPVTADGGSDANSYVITMGNLAGPVTINNTAGTSSLTVLAPPGSNTLTLSATQLTGAGESINLNLGTTATSITVDGSAGTNALLLQGAPPAPVTASNITIVSPLVGLIAAPIDPVRAGIGITASAAFTDANATDTHTAVWNWGDGSPSAGTVSASGGNGTVAGGHSYSVPGVYTVKLTVTDNTGGTGFAAFQYVVAYDPSAGFVTGGGWINSPAGAYAANPSLTGRANFGFVSRYQNGNSVPTGNTEFHFKVANFNFKSTAYEWLVVSGAKARYRGTGTVNGAGSYGFELTAWDGQANGGGGVDRFRIKIWLGNQGNGVVYDNMMGAPDGADPTTALGGGSIVIHKQGSPLLAAGGAVSGSMAPHLTGSELKPILLAAIDRWAAAGLDAKRLDMMRHATVAIENLGGSYLGLADPVTHGIRIDDDAAGHGWFVDMTPMEDAEFTTPGKVVRDRMDLVSVVAHELGHIAGLDHDGDAKDVMGDSLTTGTRRVPTAADVKEAVTAHAITSVKPAVVPIARHRPSRRR